MKKQPLVLIVDDDNRLRDVLKTVIGLFDSTIEFAEAANGLEGLNAALSVNPDVIILDFNMPVMDGYEMAMALRNHTAISHIPIILHSSESDYLPEVAELCNAVWRKPSSVFEMQHTLQSFLSSN